MSQIAFVTWNGGGNLGPALASRASFAGAATAPPSWARRRSGQLSRQLAMPSPAAPLTRSGPARQPQQQNASAC